MQKRGNPVQYLFSTSGIYPVTMEARDKFGQKIPVTKDVLVVVEPAPMADWYASGSRVAGEEVTLHSIAAELSHPNLVLTYYWDIGGTVVSSASPTHSFTPPAWGDIPVSHWVVDQWNRPSPVVVGVLEIMSSVLPSVAFTPQVSGATPWVWEMDVTSITGEDVVLHWTYGDGAQETSTGDSSHLYQDPGTYPVTCTPVDRWGRSGPTQTMEVEVTMGAAPVALFNVSGSQVATQEQLFDDQSTGVVGGREWKVNGTVIGSGLDPQPHTFATAGDYFVELRVWDGEGREDTAGQMVSITTPYAPNSMNVYRDGRVFEDNYDRPDGPAGSGYADSALIIATNRAVSGSGTPIIVEALTAGVVIEAAIKNPPSPYGTGSAQLRFLDSTGAGYIVDIVRYDFSSGNSVRLRHKTSAGVYTTIAAASTGMTGEIFVRARFDNGAQYIWAGNTLRLSTTDTRLNPADGSFSVAAGEATDTYFDKLCIQRSNFVIFRNIPANREIKVGGGSTSLLPRDAEGNPYFNMLGRDAPYVATIGLYSTSGGSKYAEWTANLYGGTEYWYNP